MDKRLPQNETNQLLIFYSRENQALKHKIDRLEKWMEREDANCRGCKFRTILNRRTETDGI